MPASRATLEPEAGEYFEIEESDGDEDPFADDPLFQPIATPSPNATTEELFEVSIYFLHYFSFNRR